MLSTTNFYKTVNWVKSKIKPGKNLVYFASGGKVKEPYFDLPYDNIFLVDFDFRNNDHVGDKIFCLKLDCICAVKIFELIGIKIDCFVCINEGLFEGGGKYPINADVFLGYCFPILEDPFLHIGYPGYYSTKKYTHYRKHYLDLPYDKKIELSSETESQINPDIFAERYEGLGKIFELSNKSKRSKKIQFDNITVTVKHMSIWSDKKQLDAIFTRSSSSSYVQKKLQSLENNVFMISYTSSTRVQEDMPSTYDIRDIIELCALKKFEKIGLVPNGSSNYIKQIETFERLSRGYPKKITYYHLNKDDYKALYNLDYLKS